MCASASLEISLTWVFFNLFYVNVVIFGVLLSFQLCSFGHCYLIILCFYFRLVLPFISPWKQQIARDFLTFSGETKREISLKWVNKESLSPESFWRTYYSTQFMMYLSWLSCHYIKRFSLFIWKASLGRKWKRTYLEVVCLLTIFY